MSPEFKESLGNFSVDVKLDDTGVSMIAGPVQHAISWDRIRGACLISAMIGADADDTEMLQRAAPFIGGPENIAKLENLQERMRQVSIAFRDSSNHLRKVEIPIPIDDPSFLQDFQSRLGKRWLGTVADEHQAEKKLHTAPGVFKTIFILAVLLGVVFVALVLVLVGMAGPFLNLVSIEQMLLSLQDGDYIGFGSRVLVYVALFIIAYFLRRLWNSRLQAIKARFRGIQRLT